MSDIVERLGKHAVFEANELEDDLLEAAAEITRLRAELANCRAALAGEKPATSEDKQ